MVSAKVPTESSITERVIVCEEMSGKERLGREIEDIFHRASIEVCLCVNER